jgi:hypothetical protein
VPSSGRCIVCHQETTNGKPLCGPDCRREAVGRREANAAILKRMPHASRSAELRRRLLTEQGLLTSALMRYDTRGDT